MSAKKQYFPTTSVSAQCKLEEFRAGHEPVHKWKLMTNFGQFMLVNWRVATHFHEAMVCEEQKAGSYLTPFYVSCQKQKWSGPHTEISLV